LQALQEQERLHPDFRFLRTSNQGPGAARNAGLAQARGELVLFFDADNIALPHLVETLMRGLERLPEVSALTCPALGVSDAPGPDQRRPIFVNAFVGGPVLLGCLENVFGDSTALFRTEALRAVGGWDTDRSTPWEDWLTYLRLIRAGFQIESVPAFLFHYRVRQCSHTAGLIQGPADRERLLQSVLQRVFSDSTLLPGVHPASLWAALVQFGHLSDRQATMRHRLLDSLNDRLLRLPRLHAGLKRLFQLLLGLNRWIGRG
jgi:glycosyltransferase involved in cell wall biosynthesis